MSDFQTEPFGQPPAPRGQSARDAYPAPPKLHWALVLLFGILTIGIFLIVWMFIQASWARKINPASNATAQLSGYLFLFVLSEVIGAGSSDGLKSVSLLLLLGSYVAFYFATYSIRRTMLDHYSSVEPMQLKLSAAMTFFFSTFYLQYHMTRIADMKSGGSTLAS